MRHASDEGPPGPRGGHAAPAELDRQRLRRAPQQGRDPRQPGAVPRRAPPGGGRRGDARRGLDARERNVSSTTTTRAITATTASRRARRVRARSAAARSRCSANTLRSWRWRSKSRTRLTRSAAAADDVGHDLFATRSATVASGAWPIAVHTGTVAEAIARATTSVSQQSSSTLPSPPRAMTITSGAARHSRSIAAATAGGALGPPRLANRRRCTRNSGLSAPPLGAAQNFSVQKRSREHP